MIEVKKTKVALSIFSCWLTLVLLAVSSTSTFAGPNYSKVFSPHKSFSGQNASQKIVLVNKCERNLLIFGGPKEQFKSPKLRDVGGLSENIFNLKVGEVVCLVDSKSKPVACYKIEKSTGIVEINSSGTTITGR